MFAWVLPFWGACDPSDMSDRCSSLPSPTVSAWSCHGAISGKCCFVPWGNFVPPKNCRAFGSGPPIPFIQIPNSARSVLCCGRQHSQDWVLDPAQPRLKAAGQDSHGNAEAVGWGREEGCNSSQLLPVNLFGLRKNYRESWHCWGIQDL